MNSTMFFTICSFFYSLLLIYLITFNRRNSKNNNEKKLHSILVISNFVGIIIEILCVVTCRNYKQIPVLNAVMLRLYLVYLLTWIMTFTAYIFTVSISKSKKNYNKIFKIYNIISILVYIVVAILIFILPMEYYVENEMVMYTYGSSVSMLYVFVEMCVILCFIFMFLNPKSIRGTKYAPLFIFIAGGAVIMILQSMHPEWLLMTAMETFVTFLIYFTSEKEEFLKNSLPTDKETLKEGQKKNYARRFE